MALGWLGEAKASCILRHLGIRLILAYSWARPAILVAGKGRGEYFYCPPPLRRKAEGHCFWLSVVRGSEFLVGTLSP